MKFGYKVTIPKKLIDPLETLYEELKSVVDFEQELTLDEDTVKALLNLFEIVYKKARIVSMED